jgi:hypothetical protein
MIRDMRPSSSRICAMYGSALAVFVAMAMVADHACAQGYMPKRGPAPLRFQHRNEAAGKTVLPPLRMEDSPEPKIVPETEPTPSELAPPASAWPAIFPVSLTVPPPPPPMPVVTNVPNVMIPAEPATPVVAGRDQPVEPSTGQSSANDLLSMTPQMFVEYFKPTPGLTNGGAASVSVPVGFMPPAPVSSSPSKASLDSR